MKVVLDTNVLVSAMFWIGAPAKLIEELNRKDHQGYSSPALIDELANVLKRDFRLTDEETREEIRKILAFVAIISPKKQLKAVRDDPTDDKVVECAIESCADYIATRDRHLLKLDKVCGIKVLKPEEVLEILKSKD